jgi:mannose-6-phosphate isomerase-like protein (cupin superfamily)
MKKAATLAAVLAAVMLAYAAGRAQDETRFADTAAIFSQMQPDPSGAVVEPALHAPAGDVETLIIGHAPRQVRTREDQLLYVISGRGTASVGYPSYEIKPGSVISIPRNTAYEITSRHGPIRALLIATPRVDPGDKKIL